MSRASDSTLATLHGARLVVRADAGPQSGAGHVMRCLALMQAWYERGGEPILVAAKCPDALIDRAHTSAGARIERIGSPIASASDAAETSAIAARLNAQWIVVDGYSFDAHYVRNAQARGARILLLDDLGRRGRTDAAIVLNQNLHAAPALYNSESESARHLLGLDYFLLREEFLEWRGWIREIPRKAKRLGIALGGADPAGQTQRLIRALCREDLAALEIAVVVGPANPRLAAIQAEALASHGRVSIHADVADMAVFLAGLDILISTAGVTAWEAAFLATPMLLATLGPQEEVLAARLAEAGACVPLGSLAMLSDEKLVANVIDLAESHARRAALSAACSGLIDGKGPDRVIDAMLREEALLPC